MSTKTKIVKKVFMRRLSQDLPFLPKIFVEMQLYHRPRTSWSADEQKAALVLFNKSPRYYEFLRTCGFILPPVLKLVTPLRN